MRKRILVAALLLAGVGAAAAEPITVRTRMIEAFGGDAEADGRLTFLGGLVMNGPGSFGAWSALLMDGDRLLAASDRGQWLTARLVTAAGRPLALDDAQMFTRRDVNGRPITTKVVGDAEALTRVDGGILVAVESSVQVLKYPADGIAVDRDATPERLEVPHRLLQAGRRHGFESLATLADGRVLAIVEGMAKSGKALPAFRLAAEESGEDGEGATDGEFTIARNGDWSITDATTLPGGDVVIVERRYGGGLDVGMRVRRLGLWDVEEGSGMVDGPVLLEAGFSSQIDNMEAVAATFEDGRMVLTFLSDDNGSILQRSLLLRFAMRDPVPRRKPARAQAGLWPDPVDPAGNRSLTAERGPAEDWIE